MFYVEKILSAILTPPGIITVILLIIPLIVVKKAASVTARWLSFGLFVIGIFFYLLSSGIGTLIYLRPLELMYTEPSKIEGDVIVVLGAGITLTPKGAELGAHTLARVLKGYATYGKTRKDIIVTGGSPLGREGKQTEAGLMRDTLIEWGVPDTKIITDNEAKTTYENAINTRKICEEKGWDTIILVTSAVHMSRAVSVFHSLGIEVTTVPTDYRYDHSSMSWIDFLPSSNALEANLAGIHEYLGQIWYSTKTANLER